MRDHASLSPKRPWTWCRKTPGQQDQEFTKSLKSSYYQSATLGMEHVSFSFSICSFLTWKSICSRFFPKQPQQLQLNCFRLGPCSSTNKRCPLIVEPLFLLGNFSNIRQRLLHLKTWGTSTPLEWAISYNPIPQSQLVLPRKRDTNPERRQSKEFGWGELEGGMALWY